MSDNSEFLLSIDLEDVRDLIPDGQRYRENVPAITHGLLNILEDARARITFFVTGPVAVRYKTLVADIFSAGHEVACHSFAHQPLDHYSQEGFEEDLHKNLAALADAAIHNVQGFRAPVLSMTARTKWVYPVLSQHGITYSSSVLPASNPLYGWPEFGAAPQRVDGVLEIPVSVARLAWMKLPFASGIYFRVLPFGFVQGQFRTFIRRGTPIVSYLHPYDFDAGQERFMHPGIHDSRFYNWLMYCNRSKALDRLRRLLDMGLPIRPYRDYVRAAWPVLPNARSGGVTSS